MRLLAHNILMCKMKGCDITHFPLKIVPEKIEQQPSDFDPEFIKSMIQRLDWNAFIQGAKDLGQMVPPLPEEDKRDDAFLKAVHDVLMDLHVIEGYLVCGHCNRKYPIHKGIVNMLLNEEEV